MKSPIDQSVALVTGASSGIGRAIAIELAASCKTLVLVARRASELEALAKHLLTLNPALRVEVQPCDLTNRDDTTRMLDAVHAGVGDVDVLVNSAGLGAVGLFDTSPWERYERVIELNVRALTLLTHRLVPGMVARGRGGVLNISSGFGLSFTPLFSVYLASKNYVSSLSEALRADLAGTGVVVTHACPGPVATPFEENIDNRTGMTMPHWVEISPERCARASLRAFSAGRAMVVPGVLFEVVMALNAVTPRFVRRGLMALLGVFARRRFARRERRG